MNINITNEFCFCCGEKDCKLTGHHVIPQRMETTNNIIISLCEKCHKEFHKDDYGSNLALLGAVMRQMKKTNLHLNIISGFFNKNKQTNEVKK